MTKKQSLTCISVVGVVCLSRLLFNIHLQKLRTLHINSIGGGCGGPYIVANKIKLSWPLSASLADPNQLDREWRESLHNKEMERNQGQLNAYDESCTAASAVPCKLQERVGRETGVLGIFAVLWSDMSVSWWWEKIKEKKKGGHGREAGNRKKTSPHPISCTHGRYINKQHAKTSAVHILTTRLKLH